VDPHRHLIRPSRFDHVADLGEVPALESLLGPVASVERVPLVTVGFSSSRHERVAVTLKSGRIRRLVLKRTVLASDWLVVRSGDGVGREAALLAEPGLDFVWQAFENPYLAFALEPAELGLLMQDLAEWLPPDVREPLPLESETALLAAIVELHARSWGSSALGLPWLMPAWRFACLLSPSPGAAGDARPPLPEQLRERVARGWEVALARVSARVRTKLLRPPALLEEEWAGLPRALVHGDVKVANFGFLPSGRVAAFDWSLVGAGPPTLDLGWYLAVNATRLSRGKDDFVREYRQRLEVRLGTRFPDALWRRLTGAAVACGALSLLWSKADALETGGPRAREEWNWWLAQLEDWA
jgi:hypothetical protein